MIDRSFDSFLGGTIGTTKKCVFALDSMSDNSTSAMRANRRESVDRTFKRIEHMTIARCNYFKRQVIFVSANLTLRHRSSVRVGIEFKKIPDPLSTHICCQT